MRVPTRRIRRLQERQQRRQMKALRKQRALGVRLPIAASALALAIFSNAQAATFTVANTDDAGSGSLRQAIIEANANPGPDIIDFNLPTSATILLSTGQMRIDDDVTITGPGADQLTIDAGGASRHFRIVGPAGGGLNVALSGLTLNNGRTTGGGAINSSDVNLALTETVLTGNMSITTGAREYFYSEGGAIRHLRGDLTIIDSTITGNTASNTGTGEFFYSYGGAIDASSGAGDLTIINSTISGNTASNANTGPAQYAYSFGGGLLLSGGDTVTIINSTISGNTADNTRTVQRAESQGGGIFQRFVDLTITNSTISGNVAGNSGTVDDALSFGGGISKVNNETAIIDSSTIANNTSMAGMGGGISGRGQWTLHNTIVAGNAGSTGAEDLAQGTFHTTYSLIGNVGTANIDDTAAPGTNVLDQDPLLGPLQNNGGPTATHVLLAGSPAIDTGDLGDFPGTDQRGVLRPHGAGPDIGAVEVSLVESLDAAVEDGTLVGSGPGKSAAHQLNALRNMLLTADELVAMGDIDGACLQLLDALKRTDGQSPPSDFVMGVAAPDLALAITETRTALGCD